MKRLTPITSLIPIIAVTVLGITNAKAGESKEQKVQLAECPAAVQKTINENTGGGKIVEVEKETKKDGTVVYEAEVKKADGSEIDIEVAADGKLISVETDSDDDKSAAK